MDDQARACPRCGLPSARLKRQDHYLSLFFIPLVPIKRGEPFLECQRCLGVFDPAGRDAERPPVLSPSRSCPGCGRGVSPDFRFCPECGQRLS